MQDSKDSYFSETKQRKSDNIIPIISKKKPDSQPSPQEIAFLYPLWARINKKKSSLGHDSHNLSDNSKLNQLSNSKFNVNENES